MQSITKILLSIFSLFPFLINNSYALTKKEEANPVIIITIGVTKNLDAQILENIKDKLIYNYNIDLKIKILETAISANKLVAQGKLDANIIQSKPYFMKYLKDYQYNLISLGNTYMEPLILYSKKYKTLNEIPKDATIILLKRDLEDNIFLGRELLLLEKAKLISLKDNYDIYNISIFDIVQKNRKILFKNYLTEKKFLISYYKNDADLFILNQDILSKIKNDSGYLLLSEEKNSKFSKVFVINPDNKNIKQLQQIYDMIISPDTSNFIRKQFSNKLIPIN